MLKLMCDFKVSKRRVRGKNVFQQLAQFRDVPLSVAKIVDQAVLRLLRTAWNV